MPNRHTCSRRVPCPWWRSVPLLVLALLARADVSSPQPRSATHPPATRSVAVDAARLIAARLHAWTPPPREDGHPDRSALISLYAAGAHAPLWVDAGGRPTARVREALNLMATASGDGLDPAMYAIERLRELGSDGEGNAAALVNPRDLAAFDVEMSAAVLRYFRDLHLGRVDPRAIGFRLMLPPETHDFALLLRSALDTDRLRETAAELAPPLAQYRALRDALARYRHLAADQTLAPPAATAAGAVRPGEPYAGVAPLHRLLVALGDLAADVPAPGADATYDGALIAAVERFQTRHGLVADGVIGKATIAALRVPLASRVRQIELALERLRWLPDVRDEPLIALNIPMFHLWAWDSVPTGAPALQMRAIVGRALSTETPVLVEEMRYLVFRPYWNVPRSILRHEILPALARDPAYLDRHDMEIVRGAGDDAGAVAMSPDGLISLLRGGSLRLRQRPGAGNALGLVKFAFPNRADVYMHGTPAQELFSRTRRDFSHGCVRLEDPARLAAWVLRDQPAWSVDRIAAAMSGTTSRRVTLTRPIRVILYYLTAAVHPGDRTVHFTEDIYRHDDRLDRALSALTASRSADAW